MNEDTYSVTVDTDTRAILPEEDETVELYLITEHGSLFIGEL